MADESERRYYDGDREGLDTPPYRPPPLPLWHRLKRIRVTQGQMIVVVGSAAVGGFILYLNRKYGLGN